MNIEIKKIISKIDVYLYKKFGVDKKLYFLENLKEAKLIFSILNENEVRFVGGCVRKAYLSQPIDDIDLATTLTPEDVKNKLKSKGIKVVDTGIAHGTVTAILNKIKFEITTLRKDLKTDGRHADVSFVSDWNKDAIRRDFTINAIYSSIGGKIFDPQNGVDDLSNGIIKFIGEPEQRIKEDYLRILRYFRFFHQYSKIKHDDKIIKIIKKNISGLNSISKERIYSELKKILSTDNIYELFSNLETRSILLIIFPQLKNFLRLKRFVGLPVNLKKSNSTNLVLAILLLDQTDNDEYFSYKFKLSNQTKRTFIFLKNYISDINKANIFKKRNINQLLYFNDSKSVYELLIFGYVINDKIKINDLITSINILNKFKKTNCPITGEILKTEYGLQEGKELGLILKKIENEWILNDFIIDKGKIDKIIKTKI